MINDNDEKINKLNKKIESLKYDNNKETEKLKDQLKEKNNIIKELNNLNISDK